MLMAAPELVGAHPYNPAAGAKPLGFCKEQLPDDCRVDGTIHQGYTRPD